jgi:hypothetical protein
MDEFEIRLQLAQIEEQCARKIEVAKWQLVRLVAIALVIGVVISCITSLFLVHLLRF